MTPQQKGLKTIVADCISEADTAKLNGAATKQAQDELVATLPFDPRKVTADPNFALPDLTDAETGWRTWGVDLEVPFGLTPKMWSVTHSSYFWLPQQVAMAECSRYGGCSGDELPGESCTCGFYSAKNLPHLLSMGYHRYDPEHGRICVLGKCALWGKVIEGSQGWRSSYAYPTTLYVPFEAAHLAKPLAEGYGCEVELLNFLKPSKDVKV